MCSGRECSEGTGDRFGLRKISKMHLEGKKERDGEGVFSPFPHSGPDSALPQAWPPPDHPRLGFCVKVDS